VGPIPIEDGLGKEVITRLTTNMSTNGVFYTDSNGRDFLKRVRDYRSDWNLQVHQPVAGNYYPINSGIYTTDNKTELSVLVDRPIGGSSIQDGQLELMLHRRCLHDDLRGVGEALNETVCVQDNCKGLTIQGKYYFNINPIGGGAKWRRTVGQEIYSPLLLAFTHQKGDDWTPRISTFTAMDPTYSLPNNVAIVTLEELEDGSVLLRLAHLYETGEDIDYSNLAVVELKKVFPLKTIIELTEMNLSANQEKSAMKLKEWKVEGYDGGQQEAVSLREIDLSKGFSNCMNLKYGNFQYSQVLDYENTTFRCISCKNPGHLQALCPLSKNLKFVKKGGSTSSSGWGFLNPYLVSASSFKEEPSKSKTEDKEVETVGKEKMDTEKGMQENIVGVGETKIRHTSNKLDSDQDSLSDNLIVSANPSDPILVVSSDNGNGMK
ncbi:hypothetical protein KI387_001306, partial [Taxus chinensis]